MKRYTRDYEGAPSPPRQEGSTILANEQIGPRRRLTPEGFLLCEAVPIARTGWMMYGPNETPVRTGDSGIAMIYRGPADLFRPSTIQSFVGKSVTDNHPPLGVEPENWRQVTVGTAHNLRQGTGDDADVLLADLLITDASAIRAVQAGKVEVSAGYDADYETTGPGEGKQLNIIGNHIALVQRGRCGPRCAIGDHLPTNFRSRAMPTVNIGTKPRKQAVLSPAMKKLILDAAAEGMESALADPPMMNGNEESDDEGGTHVHVHMHGVGEAAPGAPGAPLDPNLDPDAQPAADAPPGAAAAPGDIETRLGAIEQGLRTLGEAVAKLGGTAPAAAATEGDELPDAGGEEGGPPDEGDPTKDQGAELIALNGGDPDKEDKQDAVKPTTDSAALERGFRAVVADAEVLVPGFRVPTFDAKATRASTVDTMCATRRRALDLAYATQDGKALIDTVAGGAPDLTKMACDKVAVLFGAAAGARKAINNGSATRDANRLPGQQTPAAKGPMSIADLNAMHRKTYAH